jgi:hypothetical protein
MMLVVTVGMLLHCPLAHGEDAPALTPQADAISQQIGRLEEKINELSQKPTSTTPFWIALAALVISGLSVFVSYLNGRKALTQKANEERAKVIQDRLDRFYGPLRQMLKQSELLYLVLKNRQPDPNNFRALIALLDGAEFVGNDKALLEEIIRIGAETEKLIKESSGLVDHDLLDVLGRATSHYRVMKLAFDKTITGDTSLFAGYVFPREIGEKLDREIQSRNEELRKLRAV